MLLVFCVIVSIHSVSSLINSYDLVPSLGHLQHLMIDNFNVSKVLENIKHKEMANDSDHILFYCFRTAVIKTGAGMLVHFLSCAFLQL